MSRKKKKKDDDLEHQPQPFPPIPVKLEGDCSASLEIARALSMRQAKPMDIKTGVASPAVKDAGNGGLQK